MGKLFPGKYLFALCLALLLNISLAQAQEVIVAPGDPLVIGVSVGLSGEGIAPLGTDILRGVEIANTNQPTVTIAAAAWEITLDPQDSQCNAEGGVAVATRFTSDPQIIAVIGPMCSSGCFPAAPIYDAAGYSTISPTCSNTALTRSGFLSFNRTASPNYLQGSDGATYVYEELGIRRVATIHDGSPYSEGLVNVFSEAFSALGGAIVAADAVTVGDTLFQSLLNDIAEAEPELVYFTGFPAEGARLIQQRYDAGLEEIIFLGAHALYNAEVIELAGEEAEGILVTTPISVASSEGQAAALAAHIAQYEETYGQTPITPFNANSHDAYRMLRDAIAAVGRLDETGNLRLDRAELAAYLRGYGPVEGLSGTIACDGTGDCLLSPTGVFRVSDGAFEQIGAVNSQPGGQLE